MSNKIAVLISGEYRTFDIAVKMMPFLQSDDVDIYFSTWDTSEQLFPELNVNIVETIDVDRIKQALAPKELSGIDVESHTKYDDSYRYNTKMIDRWTCGLATIKDSKIAYRYILVMRPDIAFMYLDENKYFFKNLSDFEGHVDPGILYTCWNNASDTKRLDDVILLATAETMHASLGKLSISEWNAAENGDWHDWFWNYTRSLHLPTKRIYPCMAMCFCRGHVHPDDDYGTIHNKHAQWAKAIIRRDYIRFGEQHILKYWGETILKELKTDGS